MENKTGELLRYTAICGLFIGIFTCIVFYLAYATGYGAYRFPILLILIVAPLVGIWYSIRYYQCKVAQGTVTRMQIMQISAFTYFFFSFLRLSFEFMYLNHIDPDFYIHARDFYMQWAQQAAPDLDMSVYEEMMNVPMGSMPASGIVFGAFFSLCKGVILGWIYAFFILKRNKNNQA